MTTRDPSRRDHARPGHDGPSVAIEGFEHFERIGSGGFSAVYAARQTSLGRRVAVKVLTADVSSPVDRRAFERECQALGQLAHHPNIVTVYNEAFTVDGRPCIVMELYRRNYREVLDESGPLAAHDVLSLGVKMAGALHAAHLAGVLHRDLKPHNIFVSSYGEPALGDFGISTLDDERSISAASGLSVAYAAPEVLEDSAATVASDVYSLAATLYHLVEGAAPFASKQMRTTVRRILTETPAPLTVRDAPDELSHVLQRALAKEPSDRFGTAAAFGEAFRDVQASLGHDRTPMPVPQTPGSSIATTFERAGPTEQDDTIRRTRRNTPAASGSPASAPSSGSAAGRPMSTRAPDPISEHRHASPPRVAQPSVGTAPGTALDGEQTILRPKRPTAKGADSVAVASTDPAVSEPSLLRRRIALGAGLATVAGVIALAFTLAGGGDDDTSGATTVVETPVDDDLRFLDPPDLPTDIAVTAAADGTVAVTFTPVGDAVSYEIVSMTPSTPPGRRFSAGSSPVVADLSVTEAPCWQLVVLGDGSRISTSQTMCFDG